MAQDFIKYSDSTTAAVIESMDSMMREVSSAVSAAQGALSTLRSVSSAGGGLSSAIDGTVIGQVSSGVGKLSDAVSQVKKIIDKLNTVRQLMNKSAEWGKGPKEYKTSIGDIKDLVESALGMYDAYAEGDVDAFVAELIDAGFDIAAIQAGDPLASYLLHNAGESYDAFISAEKYRENYIAELRNQYEQGNLEIGEYLGRGLGGGLTNIACQGADMVSNLFGVDIPDSWIEAATLRGGVIGDGIAQIGEVAIDGVVDTGKAALGAVKSIYQSIF